MSNATVSRESAFGSHPSWKFSLPAVIFFGLAVLVAAYGRWVLPSRLPQMYERVFELTDRELGELQISSQSDLAKSLELGGQLDVVYSRLVTLSGNDARVYWEWAEFQKQHAERLREALRDPLASYSDRTRESALKQAAEFESDAQKTIEELAVGKSDYQPLAVLVSAEQVLSNLQSGLNLDAAAWAERLGQTIAQARAASDTFGFDEDRAELLLARIVFESLWQPSESDATAKKKFVPRLAVNPLRLQELQRIISERSEDSGDEPTMELRWQLLDLYSQMYSGSAIEDDFSEILGLGDSLEDRITLIDSSCVLGEWEQVLFLLGRAEADELPLLRSSVGKQICRLSRSSLTQRKEWLERYPDGLRIAAQFAPQVPELSELLWRCGTERDPGSDFSLISAAIIESDAKPLNHIILALQSADGDQMELAANHLKILHRGTGLDLTAQVLLWRIQSSAEDKVPQTVLQLSEKLCEIENESGLVWFVRGLALARSSKWLEADVALRESKRIMGELSAITDLLAEVGRHLPKP